MLVKLVVERSRSIAVQLSYGPTPVLQQRPTLGETRGESNRAMALGRYWIICVLRSCEGGEQSMAQLRPQRLLHRLSVSLFRSVGFGRSVLADTGSY